MFYCREALLQVIGKRWLRKRQRFEEDFDESAIDDERGNLVEVEHCISLGMDLNAYKGGMVPFDVSIVLDTTAPQEEYTLLSMACHNGHADAVQRLLKSGRVQVNKATRLRHWSPVYCAARNGHTGCLCLLLEHKCDVNVRTSAGETAIFAASVRGCHAAVELLKQYGADVDEKGWMYLTPAEAAVELGQLPHDEDEVDGSSAAASAEAQQPSSSSVVDPSLERESFDNSSSSLSSGSAASGALGSTLSAATGSTVSAAAGSTVGVSAVMEGGAEDPHTKDQERLASSTKLFKVKGGVTKVPDAGPVGLEEQVRAEAGKGMATGGTIAGETTTTEALLATEDPTARAKRTYEPAKQWLETHSMCFKISPGAKSKLEGGKLAETKVHVADVKRSAVIVSVKGWGGGMQKEDFVAHVGKYPGGEEMYPGGEDGGGATPTADFVEAVAEEFQRIGEDQIFESLTGTQQIFLQWEADELWDESDGFATFGVYIYGVARALQTNFGARFSGFVAQKLDNKKDKLTKRAVLPLDKAEKIRSQKGVQALADFFSLPVYLEVHPSFGDASIHGDAADQAMVAGAADIAFMQKHTSFGFWGHAAHCQFSDVKAIIAYGGGGTLPAEELQGYSSEAKVIGVQVTRKAGKDKSTFAAKHAGGGDGSAKQLPWV
jgi:hypothetical protein